MEKFLQNTSKLHELIFNRSLPNQHQLITVALQNNKGLKTIRFYDYTQDAICQNTAQALVDHGQQIEHLEIFQNLDYDTHAILTKLKHLKSIKFCHYSMTLAPENLKLMSLNQSQLEEIQLPLLQSEALPEESAME